jgi:hypothetical protein
VKRAVAWSLIAFAGCIVVGAGDIAAGLVLTVLAAIISAAK